MFPSRIQFFLNYHEQIQWFLITSDQLQDMMKKAACTAKMRRFHFHVLISFILWINRNWSVSFCWMAKDHERSKTYLKKKSTIHKMRIHHLLSLAVWSKGHNMETISQNEKWICCYLTVCTVVLKSISCILGYLHVYKDGFVRIQVQCTSYHVH